MKFGAKLRAYAVPEWQGAYIRYGALKAVIKRYEAKLQKAAIKQEAQEKRRQQELQHLEETPSQGDLNRTLLPHASSEDKHEGDAPLGFPHGGEAQGWIKSVEERNLSEDVPAELGCRIPGVIAEASPYEVVLRKAVEEFDALLETEVKKVEIYFWEKLRVLRDRLRAVEDELEQLDPSPRRGTLRSLKRTRSEEVDRLSREGLNDLTCSTWEIPSSSVPRQVLQSTTTLQAHERMRALQNRWKEQEQFSQKGDVSYLLFFRKPLRSTFVDPFSPSSSKIERGKLLGDKDGNADDIVASQVLNASSAKGIYPPRFRGKKSRRINGFQGAASPHGIERTSASPAAQPAETSSCQETTPRYLRDVVDIIEETRNAQARTDRGSPRRVLRGRKQREDSRVVQNLYFGGEDKGNDSFFTQPTRQVRRVSGGAETLRDTSRRKEEIKRKEYSFPVTHASSVEPSVASSERSEGSSVVDNVYKPVTEDEEREVLSRERGAHVTHLRRLQRVIVSMLDTFEKLQGFTNLNIICIYKILKKRDKKLGTQLMRESFTNYETRLSALVVPKLMKTTIVSLYRRTCHAVGVKDGLIAADHLYSFHRLQMAVQKDMLTRRANFTASRSRTLYFSMGCVCTLFVNILVLAARPATNPNFREATLIAYLPIYRFVFICNFATLACAFSMACMEAYGVNYKFLLDIDPKSQVDSTTIFGLATLQQLIFFLIFAVFLLDYKFAVFGKHQLYWMYMPTLILLQSLLLALPHSTFRLTYRKHVLNTIERVFRAGLLLMPDVTLLQNLVGDVLTSFSKPLGDLEYIFCFYATGLDHAAKPQCVGQLLHRLCIFKGKRYRAGKGDAQTQRLHLLNCGKYTSGILVIVCNSLPWQTFGVSPYSMCLIWVCSYLCATIYMFFWDVKMDWGLMPDPDHFLRPTGQSMYPKWVYQGIAVGNLIGRLTWATTLMPMSFLPELRQKRREWIIIRVFQGTAQRHCVHLLSKLRRPHKTQRSSVPGVPRLTPVQRNFHNTSFA